MNGKGEGVERMAMTLLFEPIKARILARHRSLSGAMLETYAIAVLAAMGMELGFGLLVNSVTIGAFVAACVSSYGRLIKDGRMRGVLLRAGRVWTHVREQ